MPAPTERMPWGYWLVRKLCQAFLLVLYRYRVEGREKFPVEGPVLLLSNHQSYLDPIVIAAAAPRRLRALARESLFRFGPFAWIIRYLGAIPVGSAGATLSSMRATFQHLDRGTAMLIFAEGTRTEDGNLAEIKPGILTLLRRRKPTIVPMALDGSFQAWPRQNKWPRLGRIAVVFGDAIIPEQLVELSDEQILALVGERIGSCLAEAQQLRK